MRFQCGSRRCRRWSSPLERLGPARGQYSAPVMLRIVAGGPPCDPEKILALTEGDLFIPMLTFVYGQAQLGGSAGVVSLARLTPGVLRFRAGRSAAAAAGAERSAARDRPHLRADPLPGAGMRDGAGHQHPPIRPEGRGVLRRVRARGTHGESKMKANWQILVVDDEEVMCESLAAWLREDGYAVDTASSGREAIEKAAADGLRDLLRRPEDAGRHGRDRDDDGDPATAPGAPRSSSSRPTRPWIRPSRR